MTSAQLRLFLSYGRADAADLADRLSRELRSRGHDVWLDAADIRGGAAWTAQILQGLRASSAVVAILSPHSVRSRGSGAADDSVCLDEIAIARFEARLPIVPVMAVSPPCPVPFEIYRLQYVDFSRWKESDSEFQAAFARLLEGTELALGNRPLLRDWVSHLEPQEFGDYLAERRTAFTGRQWLFDEIDDWRSSAKTSSLLLTGPPGIGKTAIVAEIVHRNPGNSLLAYHCCRSDLPETLLAGPFVRSIAAMIAARQPAYAAELASDPLRDELRATSVNLDPEAAFEKCVLKLLRRLRPASSDPNLIVIDGLDEAIPPRGKARGTLPGPTILSLLQSRMTRMPDWLRILATARHEHRVLDALSGSTVKKLDPRRQENTDDIRQFARSRFESEDLSDRRASADWNPEAAASELAKRAAGNFLYAALAVRAIADGRASPTDLESIPPDLPGIYEWFFSRSFPEGTWQKVRPLFLVLNAARDELTAEDLATALSAGAHLPIAELLDLAAPFLREAMADLRTYALYHRSLGEWLARSTTYNAPPAEGDRIIADGFWRSYEYDVEALSPYGLEQLAPHLARCTGNQEIRIRQLSTLRLAEFALNPAVQFRLQDDPATAHHGLLLALAAAVDGPPVRSAPLVLEVASGLVRFRRERLNPARLFSMAENGDLERFERELELFQAEDPWRSAARLIAAWLARDVDPEAAERLRAPTAGASVLGARVEAAFRGHPPPAAPAVPIVEEETANAILAQLGGMDLEGRYSAVFAEAADQPPPGHEGNAEGARYFAEQHAPVLVAYARHAPEVGTRLLRDYIRLQAANGYRTYRNESLWRIVPAVLEHPDEGWVLGILRDLACSALAGGGREFTEAAQIAVSAVRAANDASQKQEFESRIDSAREAASRLRTKYGEGDAWGEHRRRFAIFAECLAVLHNARDRALELLDAAQQLPGGFAGFLAPASLDLADGYRVCGAGPDRAAAALREARLAAHNIQDATFCARTTARCNALIDEWWEAERIPSDGRKLREVVSRFRRDSGSAEFSALHYVGWKYDGRRSDWRSMPLPQWLIEAAAIEDLAQSYQRPEASFERLNQGPQRPPAGNGYPVIRVPDEHFGSWLAARFSAEALAVRGLPREERLRTILRVVPAACASPTVLDKVLARLVLALQPKDAEELDSIERYLSAADS